MPRQQHPLGLLLCHGLLLLLLLQRWRRRQLRLLHRYVLLVLLVLLLSLLLLLLLLLLLGLLGLLLLGLLRLLLLLGLLVLWLGGQAGLQALVHGWQGLQHVRAHLRLQGNLKRGIQQAKRQLLRLSSHHCRLLLLGLVLLLQGDCLRHRHRRCHICGVHDGGPRRGAGCLLVAPAHGRGTKWSSQELLVQGVRHRTWAAPNGQAAVTAAPNTASLLLQPPPPPP